MAHPDPAAPADAPAPYPGQERFSDGDFHVVDSWTPELALRACRADDFPHHSTEQLERIRDAIDDDLMPPAAVDALIAAGWTELDD